MFFLTLVAIFHLVSPSHTSALNESVCAWPTTTTAPLTDEEHAKFSGHAVMSIERHSTSRFSLGEPWEMMGLANVELGPRGLFGRQERCINPAYVPICPGPKPCCPPSYTVCCNSQGGCCPAGSKCGGAGTRACCPAGGKTCGNGCCDVGETCCTQGLAGCCPSGSECCGDGHCCKTGSTCCGSDCCLTGETCCGGTNCCTSGQTCDSATGRCQDPPPPPPPPAPPSSGGDKDKGPEIEVKIFPTDPQVQYNPPDAWSSTGGACTNGTKTTTQLGAEITYKFKGIKLSVKFVPSQYNVTVTVKLNGVEIEDFDIPSEASPVCQLVNTWNKDLSSSDSDHEVTFKYKGSGAAGLGRRAPAVLELGEISYFKSNSSSASGSAKSHASKRTVVPGGTALLMTASVMTLVLLSSF